MNPSTYVVSTVSRREGPKVTVRELFTLLLFKRSAGASSQDSQLVVVDVSFICFTCFEAVPIGWRRVQELGIELETAAKQDRSNTLI